MERRSSNRGIIAQESQQLKYGSPQSTDGGETRERDNPLQMSRIQRRLLKWVWVALVIVCLGPAVVFLVIRYQLFQEPSSERQRISRTRVLPERRFRRDRPARIPVSIQRLKNGRRAIRETVEQASKGDRHAIIVDKSAYNLLVYDGDSLLARFPVELGGDPINPKERLGDSRTPEGSYHVMWRRDLGQTIYHRALLLDYPNHNDRRAGRTGSHIEIHGYGTGLRPDDGGSNWTDGCVALSNTDIDSLFAIGDNNRGIRNGTPVTIVYAGTLPDSRYRIREP
jgi:hypothetical protein